MKSRYLFVITLLAAIIVVAVWNFKLPVKSAAAPAPKTAMAAKPAVSAITAASAPVNFAPQIAASTAPPVVAPKSATPPPPTAPASDAQAELSTTIADVAALFKSGDLPNLMKTYLPPERIAQIPPELMAQKEQTMQLQLQSPNVRQAYQAMGQAFEALKDQIPEKYDGGDKVVYQMKLPGANPAQLAPNVWMMGGQPPPSRSLTLTFQKIDGKWYIQSDQTIAVIIALFYLDTNPE